ncbi:MAG: diguanylate cyclase [Succinivibrio sp.]|nr:diguanylate cyclase [Succinivibrio sp.]
MSSQAIHLLLSAQLDLMCLVIVVVTLTLLRQRQDLASRAMHRALGALAILCLCELGLEWSRELRLPQLCLCFETLFYFLIAMICALWFSYVLCQLGVALTRRVSALLLIPASGCAALLLWGLVSPGFLMYLDAAFRLQRTPWFSVIDAVSFMYLVAALGYAMGCAHRRVSLGQRREARLLMFFSAMVITAGVLQLILKMSMVAPASCLCAILYIITFHEDQICVDPLTGLNNRARLDRYLNDVFTPFRQVKYAYLAFVDVDHFKAINDTHGHLMGDEALRLTGRALKDFAAAHNAFAARFGGDEFVLVFTEQGSQQAAECLERLKTKVQRSCVEQKLPFELSLSVGLVPFAARYDSAAQLLEAADTKMYELKEQRRHKEEGKSGRSGKLTEQNRRRADE